MSGSSKRIKNYQLIASSTLSSTSWIYTPAIDMRYVDNLGLQFVWTGTPTGSFLVDASINHMEDPIGNVTREGNWFNAASAPTTAIGQALASSGNFAYAFNQLAYPWVRARYIPSTASTSGVLNIWVGAKEI